MFSPSNINDITHVIQLAIAPVFLLTAVGSIIGVLANRLSRVVDRIRVLEERTQAGEADEPDRAQRELHVLDRRLRLIYLAIGCAVFSALFVGLLIVVAFFDAYVKADLSKFVGGLFVMAMIAFIIALVVFLREIFLAVTSTHRQAR
ncbi:MAG: DUF2721 domain-containing protein [Betaproteobacteria bacterium]|nr:DUF2721 domain-containing protein [Betaproteobacteria bacterium]